MERPVTVQTESRVCSPAGNGVVMKQSPATAGSPERATDTSGNGVVVNFHSPATLISSGIVAVVFNTARAVNITVPDHKARAPGAISQAVTCTAAVDGDILEKQKLRTTEIRWRSP